MLQTTPPLFAPMKPETGRIRFQGAWATAQARQQFLTRDEFHQAVIQDTDSRVGELPPELLKSLKVSPERLFKALDEIAKVTRHLNYVNLPAFQLRVGQQSVACQLAGYGSYGRAYRMTVNGQSFVLKLFRNTDPSAFCNIGSGALGEMRTGLFLTQVGVSNLSKFYAGDPLAGWSVGEWIDRRVARKARPGITLSEAIQQYHLADADPDPDRNDVYGIRVDHGGLYSTQSNKKDSEESARIFDRYGRVPKEGRLAWFLNELPVSHNRAQFAEMLASIPEKDKIEAFKAAMEYHECRASVSKEILHFADTWQERKMIKTLIRRYEECVPTRIEQGEWHLLPAYLKKACPGIDKVQPAPSTLFKIKLSQLKQKLLGWY